MNRQIRKSKRRKRCVAVSVVLFSFAACDSDEPGRAGQRTGYPETETTVNVAEPDKSTQDRVELNQVEPESQTSDQTSGQMSAQMSDNETLEHTGDGADQGDVTTAPGAHDRPLEPTPEEIARTQALEVELSQIVREVSLNMAPEDAARLAEQIDRELQNGFGCPNTVDREACQQFNIKSRIQEIETRARGFSTDYGPKR